MVSDATLGTPTANDNCSLASVTRTGVPAGNAFPVGTTTITYRATDASGNFTEDTQVVTVIDNTPPAITLSGQHHTRADVSNRRKSKLDGTGRYGQLSGSSYDEDCRWGAWNCLCDWHDDRDLLGY